MTNEAEMSRFAAVKLQAGLSSDAKGSGPELADVKQILVHIGMKFRADKCTCQLYPGRCNCPPGVRFAHSASAFGSWC